MHVHMHMQQAGEQQGTRVVGQTRLWRDLHISETETECGMGMLALERTPKASLTLK